jgi:hypothetical protein
MESIEDLLDAGQPEATLAEAPRFEPQPVLNVVQRLNSGAWVALAALEAERFLVVSEERERKAVLQAWHGCVDALFRLEEPVEFWQWIGKPGGRAPLHSGWVAVGRGPHPAGAGGEAARSLQALGSILSSQLGFVALRAVEDAGALSRMAAAAGAPFARALRRTRWEPAAGLSKAGAAPRRRAGALLPWRAEGLPWEPLLRELAATQAAASFVVRVQTGVVAPAAARAFAAADLALVADLERAVRRAASSEWGQDAAPGGTLPALRQAAEERVRAIGGRCFALDACLTSDAPLTDALLATLGAALSSPTSPARRTAGWPDPGRIATPLASVDLPTGALLRPLELEPELLAAPVEVAALLRTVEPPVDEDFPLPCTRARSLSMAVAAESGTVLGDADHQGRWSEARLEATARLQHVYVVGQTGTGKSTLLLNMVVDDLQAGRGVTVLDPHGSLIAGVLERLPVWRRDDVIHLDLGNPDLSPGLNPLFIGSADPVVYATQRDRIVEELLDTCGAFYDMRVAGGPMFEQYFRTYLALVMGPSRPREYTPSLPMLEVAMAQPKLARVLAERLRPHDPTVVARFESMLATSGDSGLANMVPYVASKLNRFYAHAQARNVLCQSRTLSFPTLLRQRRVLLVDLAPARLGSEAAALVARQVVVRLAAAALERPLQGAPEHFVYADEFHHFATERFAQLFAEARKYRLGLTVAHQYTSQLVSGQDRRVLDAVLGNAGSVVAFRVGARDAELLADVVAPRATAADLSSLPNHWACVTSSGLGHVPFTLRTRPPHRSRIPADAALLRAFRERAARPRAEVDREVRANLEAFRKLTPSA